MSVAAHRSPAGRRARPKGATSHHGAAHRAPATGPLRAPVLAAAAAVGAVATGSVSALLAGGASGGDVVPGVDAGPVLAATAGVLTVPDRTPGDATRAGATAYDATDTDTVAVQTLQPVAFVLDDGDRDASAADRVASVEKAGRLAAQLAELHAANQREQAARARAETAIRKGGVDGWIAEALQVMDLPQSLAPGVKKIVMAESGGNPRAVNNWDSNARRGTPSRGLMQTIPSTFRAYVHPDLAGRPITDPVANITAGVRYMVDRYGMETLQAGGRSSASGSYLGY
jgi:hypothetical protein